MAVFAIHGTHSTHSGHYPARRQSLRRQGYLYGCCYGCCCGCCCVQDFLRVQEMCLRRLRSTTVVTHQAILAILAILAMVERCCPMQECRADRKQAY